MSIQLLPTHHHQSITAYTATSITVAGHEFQHSFMIGTELAPRIWDAANIMTITSAHLEYLLVNSPQIVLLGIGNRQQFLDPKVYAILYERGIGLEMMTTGAACRTYNILIGEGRRVTAGFLLD
ncbi:hypothetical protein HUU61_00110 [Rhodopseudomonas palustris]|uniref:Xcc1710-like domain-containing protein n=1 Tax=Thiospirillum jenense TaxID=1653858 RepID=A0A839H4M6_9GAMM|nr:MTH938/NDUFAF3 family protein [Thiospirillum jenense]MBB1089681.1 hypothetical protein [Rhodopseudomonas palustris]MBB1124781.1 hypothetical protein [Thiospirillum jenense]